MSWSGVKKQTSIDREAIESWCGEMDIKNYTINSKGEIDVDGCVDLRHEKFKELPYKFGKITKYFTLDGCKDLISLKNCPDYVGQSFDVDNCPQLDSLEGCPKEVEYKFYCRNCKRRFTKEEVKSLCKVRGEIVNVNI